MNYIFGQNYGLKLSEVASAHVRGFRQERLRHLVDTKNYLVSGSSVIRKLIMESANKGGLSISVNFGKLNESSQFGNFDYLFTDKELDELMITITQFLENEGCGYTITNHELVITWPEPSPRLRSLSHDEVEESETEGEEIPLIPLNSPAKIDDKTICDMN